MGEREGNLVGTQVVGINVGFIDGFADGVLEGAIEGELEGNDDGATERGGWQMKRVAPPLELVQVDLNAK